MKKKRLQELNLIDDFLFQAVAQSEEAGEQACKIILSAILGREVKNLRIVPQKVMAGSAMGVHGIRMDSYIEESGDAVDAELLPDIYDLEPNTYRSGAEPRRARYYHSMIDSQILAAGNSYDRLRNVFIINILPFDPFGKGRAMYTIKNQCIEAPEMPFEDGARTIYLYTGGTEGCSDSMLLSVLKYMENSTEENASGTELQKLHRIVESVRNNERIGISYMKSWEIEEMRWQEGREEGRQAGLQEGQERFAQLIKRMTESGEEKLLAKLPDREFMEEMYRKYNI